MDDTDRSGNIPVDSKEVTAFKSILGRMLIVGRLTNPIMLRVSSFVAAKASKLLFHHLKDIESELIYLKKNPAKLLFPKQQPNTNFFLYVNSDTAMSNKCSDGSREVFIVFRCAVDILHPIH